MSPSLNYHVHRDKIAQEPFVIIPLFHMTLYLKKRVACLIYNGTLKGTVKEKLKGVYAEI